MREDHFAQRLNNLFLKQLKEDGRPYTHQEVADATNISASTISRLRSGKEANPSFQTMYRICEFFEVPLSYFDPNLEGIIEKKEVSVLDSLSHRSAGSNDETQEQLVTDMFKSLLKLKESLKQSDDE